MRRLMERQCVSDNHISDRWLSVSHLNCIIAPALINLTDKTQIPAGRGQQMLLVTSDSRVDGVTTGPSCLAMGMLAFLLWCIRIPAIRKNVKFLIFDDCFLIVI